ncbi:MAG: glycosyltransferase [Acidobacteria bacterium]|nr:MAG: glycosyltransferase [Acidobacteriota bacterium]
MAGHARGPAISAVVPTLGASPWLASCLRALRREGEGRQLEILVVDQGPAPSELPAGLADRLLRLPRPRGFAHANNHAIALARGELIATVNDDAVVAEGWLAALLVALDAHPEAGAVQGTNLTFDQPPRIDGRGLAWNRCWQAVQIDRGKAPQGAPARGSTTREIFGVSATAALYRRAALEAACGVPRGAALRSVFEPRLGSYYEDVELAIRLRRAGWSARWVAPATARHAGSTSGARRGLGSRPWIYGNRLLVLARLFGRAFWPRLPRLLLRDAIDLWHAVAGLEAPAAAGILAGWGRATVRLPRFVHRGAPLVPPVELARFRTASWPEPAA